MMAQNPRSSIANVNEYHQQGFISSLKVLDPEMAREFAASFDQMLVHEGIDLVAPGFRLHDRHLDQDFIWEVATDPGLLDVVAEIAGPHLLILGSRFICKPPQSELGVPWHRDATFAGLDPIMQVNVWLAVDDVDLDNGCLNVLPKGAARRAATLEHVPAPRGEGRLVDQQLSLTSEECAALAPLPLDAGVATVFDGDLVHGSASNTSSRRRCGLAFRYTSARTRLLNEGQWAAVCVTGTADEQGGRVLTREHARTFLYRKTDKFGTTK
jgi:non-haem Fe2+, alpha-ketoglutarate-dependent halogenase